MTSPESGEVRPPHISEADKRHVAAFVGLQNAMKAAVFGDAELGTAVGELLNKTVRPAGDDYSDIRDQMERWKTAYSFDSVSTRYGDRAFVVEIEDEDNNYFTDPDGSGARSANAKRAGLVYDVALYLATTPDSLLSGYARATVIRSATQQAAHYRNVSLHQVRDELRIDLLHHIAVYRDIADTDNFLLVLGATEGGGIITQQQALDLLPYTFDSDIR